MRSVQMRRILRGSLRLPRHSCIAVAGYNLQSTLSVRVDCLCSLSSPIHIILVKNKHPDLDTMSRLPVGHVRVSKSGVWDPPSTSISLPVVAFDQHDLLWGLLILVVPAMVLVGQDRARLSHPAGMNQLDWQDVLIRYRVRVADGQWVLVDGLDRTPHIDDLETRL